MPLTNRYQQRTRRDRNRSPCLDEPSDATDLTEDQVRQVLAVDFAVMSLDKPVSEEEDAAELGSMIAPSADSPDDEVIDRLSSKVSSTPPGGSSAERNWYVLCRRYGLEGHETATLQSVGRELGVSGETVRTIEQQPLAQLQRAIERPLSPA